MARHTFENADVPSPARRHYRCRFCDDAYREGTALIAHEDHCPVRQTVEARRTRKMKDRIARLGHDSRLH